MGARAPHRAPLAALTPRAHPVADLAAFLTGRWSVARTINDTQGSFDGVAEIGTGNSQDSLIWHETGELELDGAEVEAYRTLLVVPDNDAWEVRFDDGRPFHPLDLRAGRADVEHLCGPDTYRGTYLVTGAGTFCTRWHVTGPGREDVLVTAYRKLPPTR